MADHVDLAAFVEEAIVQVIRGVAAAQAQVKADAPSAAIVPESTSGGGMARQGAGTEATQLLDFDVAVTTQGSREGGGGLRIAVFGIGTDAEAKATYSDSTVSRIRFKIPVLLPEQAWGREYNRTEKVKG